MYMPSQEISRIMVMNEQGAFLEIVNILKLTLLLKHNIYQEPEKERLMMCFKSIHHSQKTEPPLNPSVTELFDNLSKLIPPPRRHRYHYHGVLAPNSP